MKKGEATAPLAGPAPAAAGDLKIPMPLDEFVRSHEPRREVEMKAGFRHFARSQGWTESALPEEWKARYEAFRNRPVG